MLFSDACLKLLKCIVFSGFFSIYFKSLKNVFSHSVKSLYVNSTSV